MKKLKVKDLTFQNLQEKDMTFEEVFERIKGFMGKKPIGSYRLIIGTDSQVHRDCVRFITGVVIYREGKGAWACIRKYIEPRKIMSLHERISLETSLTEEVASMFTEERKEALIDIVLPYIYDGASFIMEGHIDIGTGERNKTKLYVNEMVSRIESMGIEPKIKPNSFVASGYANRYTK